jgi:MoaA/NifB/PqqE/SkfB family radical SAM enzyme|tara:strand:+ start:394 stop:1107 length:714 start_codon:yes stop_codon:yes gene_type:complete
MVDLSTYCNAQCPQCHRTDQEDISKRAYWLPLVQWSLKTFQKRFPQLSLHAYRNMSLCGTWGDPMMNKDIFKIIEYILSHSNIILTVNTNGSMRDETFWWELGMLDYKYNHRLNVIFDIDGITQEQHATYRVGTELDKVLEHMQAYSETGATAKAFTIVFKHNEDDVKEIAKLAYSNGACRLYIQPSNRFDKNPDTFRYIQKNKIKNLHPSTKYTKFKEIILSEEIYNDEKNKMFFF